jgi:hypothetical protein
VKKAFPHEFFHSIQFYNNNQESMKFFGNWNAWFEEGTAGWASDEVYDDIPGLYHATTWMRFYLPLNQEMPDDTIEYETVGFWKWVEAKAPGSILATILNQQLATHSLLLPTGQFVENGNAQPHQNAFLAAYPDPDFLDFVVAAKYTKDFDTNETLAGDLWSPKPQLGSPGEMEVFASNEITLRDGDPGDSKDNPRRLWYTVTQFLSIDAFLIHSDDLSGLLHIKFPESWRLDAAVIIDSGGADGTVTQIRDLSLPHEEFVAAFSPDRRATILLVDPRWFNDPGDFASTGEFEIWMEDPCGEPSGTVVDVSNTDELVAALHSATAGDMIRLAAGTYYPPVSDWTVADWAGWNSPYLAHIGLDGVSLAGAGSGATTIMLSNRDAWFGMLVGGDTVIRDLKLVRHGYPAIEASGNLKLCNVAIQTYWYPPYYAEGIDFVPQVGGSYSLLLSGCSIRNMNTGNPTGDGIYIDCLDDAATSIAVMIGDTAISGFPDGVEWDNVEYQTTSVSIENCELISGSVYNAVEWVLDYKDPVTGVNHCNLIEHCPR